MSEWTAVVNGHNIIMAMLISELDQRGHLDARAFAQLLRETADAALHHDPAIPETRADIIMIRNLASLAERPATWEPVVVEGGKDTSPEK